MSLKRVTKSVLTVIVMGCLTTVYLPGPSSYADDCTDDSCVVVLPPPVNNPPAPPKVTRAHRHGYIKACEPSVRHNGTKILMQYGAFRYNHLDGQRTIRAGSCLLIRVHRHTENWIAFNKRTGARIKQGTVRHIRL